jgi:hypothetical protein
MKKLICILATIVLISTASLTSADAIQSLGWWNEGAVGSTHQYWDFTPGYVRFNLGDGYTASPENVINPDPLKVLATISPGGAWDGNSLFTGFYIYVNLELPNYDVLNPYKEIWVDLGNAVVAPGSIALSAAGHDMNTTDYRCEVLSGPGPSGVAEFGVKIWPNPEIEKIGFLIPGTTAPAVLDYIHVDTICIPEPATICILGFGALSLIRRKK